MKCQLQNGKVNLHLRCPLNIHFQLRFIFKVCIQDLCKVVQLRVIVKRERRLEASPVDFSRLVRGPVAVSRN